MASVLRTDGKLSELFSKVDIIPKRINPLECEKCGEEKRSENGAMACIKCGDTKYTLVPELDLNSWKKKKSIHLRDKWFSN